MMKRSQAALTKTVKTPKYLNRSAPTRASLMSGRYDYNTGMNEYNQRNITTEERAGVPKSFDFIPKVRPALSPYSVPGKTHCRRRLSFCGAFAPPVPTLRQEMRRLVPRLIS